MGETLDLEKKETKHNLGNKINHEEEDKNARDVKEETNKEEKTKDKKNKKKEKDGKGDEAKENEGKVKKTKNPDDKKDLGKLKLKLEKIDAKIQALETKREEILKLLNQVENKASTPNEEPAPSPSSWERRYRVIAL